MSLTIGDYERFMELPVWREFQKELEIIRMNNMENAMVSNSEKEIWRAQGRNQAIVDLLKWPEMQIEAIKATKD